MKIQRVKIKEFKKLKDIDLKIDGQNIWIKGENGMGKSTLMQFIEAALGSKNAIPPNTNGSGHVWADKDGKQYVFSLELKDGKTKVVVECDGMKDSSKSAIAAIVGKIDFDIDEFVKLSETEKGRKEQVILYKNMMPQEVIEWMARIEHDIKAEFEDRAGVNSKIKTLEGFIKESPLFGKDLDIKPKDAAEIQYELEKANKINDMWDRATNSIVTRKQNIAKWEEEITALMAKCEKDKTDIEIAEKWLFTNKKVDIGTITSQFDTISEHNKIAHQAAEQKKKVAEVEKLKEEAGNYTVRIETKRHELQECVKSLDPIVDGLSFDEEGLVYKGTPLHINSMATSEIIELGFKMKMAQNPDLGIICLEHGESIGNDRLKYILDIAKKNNWQVMLEHVVRGQDKLTIEFIGGEYDKT